MRRTATAAVIVCASLLAASLVSPAFGGPSVGSVAKTAKSALKVGKAAKRSAASAQRTASSAKRNADAASGLAVTANGKADQALARPTVNPAGITIVSNQATIPASGSEVISAVCPAGQRVIAGGVMAVSSAGGVWMDVASDDRTAWLGGGEDLGGSGGALRVEAYCVPAGAATIASANRSKIRREIDRALAAKRAAENRDR